MSKELFGASLALFNQLKNEKVSEAPNDNKEYVRKNKAWVESSGGGLPTGTTNGQALVYHDGEWKLQNGYGYTTPAISIEWDGVITGRDTVNIMDAYYLYKVSDNFYDFSTTWVGGKIYYTITEEGETQEGVSNITSESYVSFTGEGSNVAYMIGEAFAMCANAAGTYTKSGISFSVPSAGTYLCRQTFDGAEFLAKKIEGAAGGSKFNNELLDLDGLSEDLGIDDLTDTVTSHGTSITNINSSVNNLNNTVSTHGTNISDLTENVNTLTTNVTNLDNNKLDNSKCTYQTTAPTEAISDGGVHIVVLSASSEASTTKYSGYIYLFTES